MVKLFFMTLTYIAIKIKFACIFVDSIELIAYRGRPMPAIFGGVTKTMRDSQWRERFSKGLVAISKAFGAMECRQNTAI